MCRQHRHAANSAALGLGPAELLTAHGIPVVADLPGVGGNLQDHLQIRAVYKIQGAPTLNVLSSSWLGKARIGLEYLMKRSGPMSMAPSQLGAFTRSDPSQPYPNIEYHVQPLSLDAFGEPLHAFPAFTASVCNLNPTSRGRVSIPQPALRGRARHCAELPCHRRRPQGRGRFIARYATNRHAASACPLLARGMEPGPQYETDEELARLAGDIATTIFHPVGTTKMGRDNDSSAVLDAQMRVRDGRGGRIAGLRVVDAGAMPLITSGNTNSPTLMMAEKAAAWIRAEHRGRCSFQFETVYASKEWSDFSPLRGYLLGWEMPKANYYQ